MTATIISAILLGTQFVFLYRNIEKGTILSIVLILVAPNFLSLSYELLGTFLLIFSWLVFRNRMVFYNLNKPIERSYLLIFCLLLTTTICYSLVHSIEFNIVGIIGLIRVFAVIFIYKVFFKKDGLKKMVKILNIVLVINFIVFIVQMTVPASVQFFYDMYWKPSLTPLDTMLEAGAFSRPFGTFGTPLYLSILLLISTSIYFYLWATQKKCTKWFIYLGMTTIISVFSYSKTTYFGFIIVILLELVLITALGKWQHMLRKIGVMIFVAVIGIAVLLKVAETDLNMQYYLSFFENPLKIFETRYGEDGNIQDVLEVVKQHPIFGVGISAIQEEFLGDSAYYGALHDCGFVGLSLYMFIYLYLIFRSWKQKNIIGVTLAIACILVGLGVPIFTNYIGSIVVGFVYGMLESGSVYNRRHIYENITVC